MVQESENGETRDQGQETKPCVGGSWSQSWRKSYGPTGGLPTFKLPGDCAVTMAVPLGAASSFHSSPSPVLTEGTQLPSAVPRPSPIGWQARGGSE